MSSKNDIVTLPHGALRERSVKVGKITDDILEKIEHMKLAALDWEASRKHEVGVALAAIQIDIPLKIVIIRSNFDNKNDKSFQVFINPKITKYEGAITEDYEGCLSIKDVYGLVPRYSKVRVNALDENGQPVRVKASGFLARIFQHEIDHINGTVFIDHIKDKPESFFKLNEDGSLKPLNYEKDIRDNSILW